jgi:hypothetical protein
LLLALIAGTGWGEASAQEPAVKWAFSSLPLVDLWFHGMALVDPIDPGPVPLYDPDYPNEVGRAKEEAGIDPSVFDRSIGHFREAFRRDPAFELFHFLPLYFPQAGRTEVLEALELLARTAEGLPRAPSARTSFGLAAVGSVLATQRQRQTLGEFVGALSEE